MHNSASNALSQNSTLTLPLLHPPDPGRGSHGLFVFFLESPRQRSTWLQCHQGHQWFCLLHHWDHLKKREHKRETRMKGKEGGKGISWGGWRGDTQERGSDRKKRKGRYILAPLELTSMWSLWTYLPRVPPTNWRPPRDRPSKNSPGPSTAPFSGESALLC